MFINYLTLDNYITSTSNEHFNDLLPFENVHAENIFDSVNNLLEKNPDLLTSSNSIIYLINTPSGFGSVLTVFLQNTLYLLKKNPSLICLPHFSINNDNFKYHDESYNNSFFLYFKYKNVIDISKYKLYMVQSHLINDSPFVEFIIPLLSNSFNKSAITWFHENFSLRIGNDVKLKMDRIKKQNKNVIGIHLRSLAQKAEHNKEYLNISLDDRLINIKNKLDKTYNTYHIVIGTDVNQYITRSKYIFGEKITYLSDIKRISNEEDSIPQLESFKGFNLGKDILYECLLLSLCDHVFVSKSNIPFIITALNPNISLEEY